jgi:RimJ/RimL family protein N-acetyltransferase
MAARRDTRVLIGPRLVLEPLRVEHAWEMSALLEDPTLYGFTGDVPPTPAVLSARYRAQAAGRSPDGAQQWLNWIVRLRDGDVAVGYVQATLTGERDRPIAELAWVIGSRYQGRGYAREAASMMLGALQTRGVHTVRANIHPHHQASNAVARRIGMSATGVLVDGEMRWQGTTRPTLRPEDEPG